MWLSLVGNTEGGRGGGRGEDAGRRRWCTCLGFDQHWGHELATMAAAIHYLALWFVQILTILDHDHSEVFSSAFSAIALGFTSFTEIFTCVTVLNPTIKVVTFRLRGWCMLGVFVAEIHPSRTWVSGSFESVRWNACVHRLNLGLYSHPKELGRGGWSLKPYWLQGKYPLNRRLRRGSAPQRGVTGSSRNYNRHHFRHHRH